MTSVMMVFHREGSLYFATQATPTDKEIEYWRAQRYRVVVVSCDPGLCDGDRLNLSETNAIQIAKAEYEYWKNDEAIGHVGIGAAGAAANILAALMGKRAPWHPKP